MNPGEIRSWMKMKG